MPLAWSRLAGRAPPPRPARRARRRTGPTRRAIGMDSRTVRARHALRRRARLPGGRPSLRRGRRARAARSPWWSRARSSRRARDRRARRPPRGARARPGLVRRTRAAGSRCIGVTGTNGKTTTAGILRHLLNAAGTRGQHRHARRVRRRTASGRLDGGVAHDARDRSISRPRSPSWSRAGHTHVAMEASSHSLDQGRLDGLAFARRRVHQPHARPSRLPRHDGAYLAAKLG